MSLNDSQHVEAAALIRRLRDLTQGLEGQADEFEVVQDADRWLFRNDLREGGPVCGPADGVRHHDGPASEVDLPRVLRALAFRPERSRPVFRNRHTGKEVVVMDLAVNDHGGFQGGCRQHVVVTDEPPPPGPYAPRGGRRGARGHNVHPVWAWIEHWEPTGRWVDWAEAPEPDPAEVWRVRAHDAERRLAAIRGAITTEDSP